MIPIYICDDDPKIVEHVTNMLSNIILIENYDMKVVLSTTNPIEIIHHKKTNPRRSIYFFDVDLKNKAYNGFTLAKEIRTLDTRGFLVFITTFEELMFETFKYRLEAMSYLIKDDPTKLREQVNECLHNIQELIRDDDVKMRKYYTLTIADSTYQIPMDEIIYFETSNQYHHRVVLHTEKRILEFRGNLNGIEEDVGEGFLRVHRSYLVQVSKIQQVNYTENKILLEKGNVCLLARNAKKKIKEYLEKGSQS